MKELANILCYPKLNIFLKILNKRSDGFHNFSSRFALARGGLFDILHITRGEGFSLKGDFDCKLEKNSIYKAKLALQDILKQANNKDAKLLDELCIEVEKNIPSGAGLGGGSADAGGFAKAFCKYINFTPSLQDRFLIATKCGMDTMFFLSDYDSANVFGIGEVIESFEEASLNFEIYTPEIFCATPIVYENYAKFLSCADVRRTNKGFIEKLQKMGSEAILKSCSLEDVNDLYLSASEIYPALLDEARNLGKGWFFSGSGSSFFRLK